MNKLFENWRKYLKEDIEILETELEELALEELEGDDDDDDDNCGPSKSKSGVVDRPGKPDIILGET
jgi:hypothetical protein